MISLRFLFGQFVTCFLYCLIHIGVSGTRVPHPFHGSSVLNHGVHQLTYAAHGIRARQTAVGPKEGSSDGLVVRELSNSRQLVNLIYNGVPPHLREEEGFGDPLLLGLDSEGLELRRCEVVKAKPQVNKWVRAFDRKQTQVQNGVTAAEGGKNTTFVSLRHFDRKLPLYVLPLTHFHELKIKCFRLNRLVRRSAKEAKINYDITNHVTQRRHRRSVSNLLSIPNTKWCGKGYSARSYNDLGGLFGADSCCRQHDLHCPFFIRSFERKYGYFNMGLGTISHCSCDRRFKTCLKQTGTGAADVVGNVFFRIVQSKCFLFRRRRVCKKRDFWRCLKWGYMKQAVIRQPVSWNQRKKNH